MTTRFRELATRIVKQYGGKVIPLLPNSKAPNTKLAANAAHDATSDPLQIAIWDKASPEAGVGWVATPDTVFFVEEDEKGAVPSEPFINTFTVLTGSGKLHRVIKHNEETRAWGNYSKKVLIPDTHPPKHQETFSVRTNFHYVAGPGTIHPDTGLPYAVSLDVPIVGPTSGQLEWLRGFMLKEPVSRQGSVVGDRQLSKTFTMEAFLKHYGIEFKHSEKSNKYHVHFPGYGCPCAGRMHMVDEKSMRPREIEQSSFIWEAGTPPGFECLSGGCYGKTFKDAHSAIIAANPTKKIFKIWEKEEERSLVFTKGNDIRRKKPSYLWEPFLALGKLIHLMGMSGEGKSPVTVDIAARITAGARWPDGQENTWGPRSVIMMNMEDDVESVIMPRFDLAGGNGDKFYFVEGTRFSKDAKHHERTVALDSDMDLLIKMAESLPDLALIVIDPISNYLGRCKMNAEEEVRGILSPLAGLAQQREISVMNVGHINKREAGTSPQHRAMGAAAFIGVSREMYAFGPDPDSTDKHAHMMVPTRNKSNPGMRYKTYVKDISIIDRETGEKTTFKTEGIEWAGRCLDVEASQVIDPPSSSVKSKIKEAGEFLKVLLKAGKVPVKTCLNELKNAGFDSDKVDMVSVRKYAGAESTNEGKNSHWRLKSTFVPKETTDGSIPDALESFLPDTWEEGRE